MVTKKRGLTPFDDLVGGFSEWLAGLFDLDEPTVSAQVAENNRTSVQGAHMKMLVPLLLLPGGRFLYEAAAETEAVFAHKQAGPAGVREVRRQFHGNETKRLRRILDALERVPEGKQAKLRRKRLPQKRAAQALKVLRRRRA